MDNKDTIPVAQNLIASRRRLKLSLTIALISVFCLLSHLVYAASVQECMGKVKMFQNPSAMAGAAEVCMQTHFDNLKEAADTCRQEAAAKAIPSASYAACQTSLIFELAGQVNDCEDEAEKLLTGDGEMQGHPLKGPRQEKTVFHSRKRYFFLTRLNFRVTS